MGKGSSRDQVDENIYLKLGYLKFDKISCWINVSRANYRVGKWSLGQFVKRKIALVRGKELRIERQH
jgi:hypothetical protein